MSTDEMNVTKRSGAVETVSFDKILHRIKTIGTEAGVKINYTSLAMKIIDQLYDKISTTKIDELTAEQCASLSSTHYDYGTIASHIVISNHHKNTVSDFRKVVRGLYNSVDINGNVSPLVSKELYDVVEEHGDAINAAIDFRRDYLIDYFGFRTLEKSYLMRSNRVILERPQHMWMRVALGIHGADIAAAIETYHLMSQKYFTHATPTLFNAGTPRPQLSSCFLIAMEEDSINGIYNTLKDCALISKWAGGIGMHIHNVRATGSQIRGTNGNSNGIVPMLRVFNNTAKYVDQCVTPETYIYTTQGPIEIQNCSYGETQVFNLTGGVETIQNILEHPYEGQIYNIETMHSIDNLRITPEHPVYALVGQVKGLHLDTIKTPTLSADLSEKDGANCACEMRDDANYTVIENRLNKNISQFEWVDAKDLQNDDMLVYKIPTHSTDIDEITADDCYMYGVLLGDGCLSNADQNGYISLHSTNKKYILDFAIQYFENKCIQYRINTNENTTRIYWHKNINMPFRYSDVYDSNKTKRAHHKWLNLPIEKSKYVLKGLIDTDGCKHLELFGKCARISQSADVERPEGEHDIQLSFDSTSRNLIESVRFLCLKLGVLTSGYTRDRIGETHVSSAGSVITNQQIAWCLKIPQTQAICELLGIDYNDNQFFKFFRYNDFLLTRIKSITTEEYSGTLYDLQMKTQHDYMIHNCIVHNGGGRRNGSFAIYLEPWHADIEMFLEMRKNHGDEELKARDLFYALWIPDLFMERVKADGTWTLMCPNECPGLADVYGEAFVALYTKYEQAGRGRATVKARELWFKVLDAQMETGTPYICYKDAANRKSNQQNVGTIKSSNLCAEILEYSDENETAVCNLASIALPTFVENAVFNYDKLTEVAGVITRNLNCVIDINYYPTEKTRVSNMRHRPIGIGVQGLADVFLMMNVAYHSDAARELNRLIFETIYYGATKASADMAAADGPYPSFAGSPASKGQLQFDLWNVEPTPGRYDWTALKAQIQATGMRNSLLLAPMPTASTSQILGFNECFEPFTSNIYSRRTMAGEFILTNKYLMRELIALGLWNTELKNNIIANQGSIQHIENLPEDMKQRYKTVWEIPMRHVIDMAADRGAFICQSQSLNLWIEDPTYNSLTSMHFYSWSKGLKTGIYYLRRRGKHRAQQFTIEPKNGECELCSA
jgi:ribonucleoside-diphosphate reductase alpha subunit